MGRYRSAMFLGRLYCPETLLGLPTEDELRDVGPQRERVVGGERVLDEEPINMPRATEVPGTQAGTAGAEPAASATDQPAVASDPAMPEVREARSQPHATAADPTPSKSLDKPASEAQRKMILGIAEKHCKLTAAELDERLAEKFAVTLSQLPMGLVNEALAFVRELQPA